MTIQPPLRKVERLLNQTREFSSVHFSLFLAALFDPIDFKATGNSKHALFHT